MTEKLIPLILGIVLAGCASTSGTSVRDTSAVSADQATEARNRLLVVIDDLNRSAETGYSANLSVSMRTGGRRVSASGTLLYSPEGPRWKVKLRDPFLGTLVYQLLIEGDTVTGYSSLDKTAFRSSISRSALPGQSLDIASALAIATGRVTLLNQPESYTLLKDDDGESLLSTGDAATQTIRFRNGTVSGNEIIAGESTLHVAYSGTGTKDIQRFSRVRADLTPSGEYIEIGYENFMKKTKIPEKEFTLSIPAGTRIIE